MRTARWIPVVLIAGGLVLFVAAQEFTYVGAAKCQICHRTEKQGRQYPIWEAGLHSKSFTALSTPQAADVAKSMNVSNPAENAVCLGCHSPLAAKAPELKAEGVTCEVCHGPGSEYRKLNIMKDPAAAAKSGLITYPDKAAIQAQCLKCHQNAHGRAFDFNAAWEKVKHPVPGK